VVDRSQGLIGSRASSRAKLVVFGFEYASAHGAFRVLDGAGHRPAH